MSLKLLRNKTKGKQERLEISPHTRRTISNRKLLQKWNCTGLEVETADARVVEHDVAVWMSAKNYGLLFPVGDVPVFFRFGRGDWFRRRAVEDDILEDDALLENREDRDLDIFLFWLLPLISHG